MIEESLCGMTARAWDTSWMTLFQINLSDSNRLPQPLAYDRVGCANHRASLDDGMTLSVKHRRTTLMSERVLRGEGMDDVRRIDCLSVI